MGFFQKIFKRDGEKAQTIGETAPEIAALIRTSRITNNPEDNCTTAKRLIASGSPAVIPFLKSMLDRDAFGPYTYSVDVAEYVHGRFWAEELKAKRDYRTLVRTLHDSELLNGPHHVWKGRSRAAQRALEEAGGDAVDALLEALPVAEFAVGDIAELLVKIHDTRAIPLLQEVLERGQIPGGSAHHEISKFVYNDPKGLLNTILAAGHPREETEAAVRRLITGLGYDLGQRGNSLVFCSCGYPVQVAYYDGTRGPLFDLVDSEPVADYTHKYTCPRCHSHIATLTT